MAGRGVPSSPNFQGQTGGAARVVNGLETVKRFDGEISLADKLAKKTRS